MDSITLAKIATSHPEVRDELSSIYTKITETLTGRAICRFPFVYRSFAEQDAFYAQGRTKLYDARGNKLGIVTKAKGGQSIHNYGLAVDICLLVDTNKDGRFETASWETAVDFDKDGKADWMEVVSIFKAHGWAWGGDWKSFKDKPHFEKTFGNSWQTLLAKYKKGEFIPGTEYVRL